MNIINLFSELDFKKNKPIYILGDSHVRCFSFNKNFIPMFVGEGKKHNFINDHNYNNVLTKTLKILRTIPNNFIVLFFGEPDTRFLLGKGWTPWDTKLPDDESGKMFFEKTSVDECLKRYRNLIEECLKLKISQLLVLSVSPSIREEQNRIVKMYNKKLHDLCKELKIDFINIEDDILNNEKLNMEYYGDPVHLNNKIQLNLEHSLINKKILKKSFFNSGFKWNNKEVQNEYVFNEQFGCFIQKQ
jgi:hypothetical protein